MINVSWLAALSLLVAVTACARVGGQAGTGRDSAGGRYLRAARGGRSDLHVACYHGHHNTAGDKRPTDTFQFYFVRAVQAAKPKRVVMAGKGTSLATAFFAHDLGEREELQAAMNDLLARYPDRHDVRGVLMRGTNRKYVLHVTFVANGAPRELYYDVSRWVGHVRVHG